MDERHEAQALRQAREACPGFSENLQWWYEGFLEARLIYQYAEPYQCQNIMNIFKARCAGVSA